MPDGLEQLLGKYKESARRVLGDAYAGMILYGSYARGDYREDSDIDILILINGEPEDISFYADKLYDLAYDLEEECGVEINPVVQSRFVYEYWKRVSPFFMNIDREGVAV